MPKNGPFRIQVRSADDRYIQMVTCVKSSLTIGSGADNDLLLNGPLVQKYHARIDFYGKQVQFVQLAAAKGNSQRQPSTSGEEGKVEPWKVNTSKDIGEFKLTLLGPTKTKSNADTRWNQFWRGIFGSSINLNNLSVAGLPFAKLSRAWWLFGLIFGGGLLLGSLNPFLWRYMPNFLPHKIIFTPTPTETSSPTVEVSVSPQVTESQPIVILTLQPISTTPTVVSTPTRLNIFTDDSEQNRGNASPSPSYQALPLIDGPEVTPIGPMFVQVTVTPTPEPTPTPTPTIPPVDVITLSEVLQQLKVWIEPASVPIGREYWRLAEARWLNEDEALGRNYIFVEVVDSTGNRLLGQDITIAWKDGSTLIKTNKPLSEPYALDFGMNASGNAYDVWVNGLPSDKLHGLGMGTVAEPFSYTKTAFWLKFQRTIRK